MSEKLKVASLAADWDGVSYYRAYLPFAELALQGKVEFLDNRRVFEADVVLVQRVFLGPMADMVRELKRHGARLLYDIDDDPFHVPPQHPAYSLYQAPETRRRLNQTLSSVDLIVCATEPLKRVLAERLLKKVPIEVIGNYLDFRSFWSPELVAQAPPARPPGKLIIGWSGGLGHKQDLELLRGLFAELARRYGARVHFRFLGTWPEYIKNEVPQDQFEAFSWVEVSRYSTALYQLGLDLALIPLVDNQHNRSKTMLKFLEFSALRVPCVASDVGPYRSIPEGCAVKVENRPERWLKAVCELVEREAERKEMAERAYSYVRENFDIARGAQRWLEALLATRPEPGRKPFALKAEGAPTSPPPVDIVVPIHNAYKDVVRCLDSLLEHTDLARHRLILIDDGSTDRRVPALLERFARLAPVELITHAEPWGFVRSCNQAMRLSKNDVVLLNSDTVVPERWLEKLQQCAYARRDIGTVTPLSNEATILTIPVGRQKATDGLAEVNAFLEQRGFPYLEIPVGVGFCLYIKREVLEKYGYFDAETFGMGYGEENDLCLRIRPEYRNVADTRTFVYHKGGASFGAQAAARRQENEKKLREKHPIYESLLLTWHCSDPLLELRAEVSDRFNPLPKVLHVVHSLFFNAGTELFTQTLMRELKDGFRSFAIYPEGGFLAMAASEGWGAVIPTTDITRLKYVESEPRSEAAFRRYLELLRPDIVHFQHLIFYPLNFPRIAREFGARCIWTLHDSYMLCPDPFLMDRPSENFEHCLDAQKCASSGCFTRKFGLPAELALRRRALVKEILEKYIDIVIAPSAFIARMAARAFGINPIIVPHGVRPLEVTKRPSQKTRIGFIGNVTSHKGAQLLFDAFSLIEGENLELNVYGNLPASSDLRIPRDPRIKLRGPFRPADLQKVLAEIDIAVVPSLVPESFCFTLSELAQAKIPTLVSNRGALPERVDPAVVFEPTVEGLRQKLLEMLADPKMQARAARYAYEKVTFLDQELAFYRSLYSELISGRLCFSAQPNLAARSID